MEKNDYRFIRNDQNKRIFVENDIVVLRHFQNLVKQHNMQLDNAAKLVIDRFGKGAFEVSTGIVPAEDKEEQHDLTRSDEEIKNELREHIRVQEIFNQELINRLDEQQKYIGERFETHLAQRDYNLMESLRESQKIKQQLLQIAVAQEEEKKKGFFARLFNN